MVICKKPEMHVMKIAGFTLVWILLFGALVTQSGMLSASAMESVPLSPRNLNASPVSDTQISLTWNPPINATGVTGYQIEYKTGSGSYSVLSITGNLTTYLHTGLVTNTTYTYRVSTINSAGMSNPSNESIATTLSVPSAPRNLSATVISSSQINLIWSAPSNDGGTLIQGYTILRENSCTGIFVTVVNTTNSSTTYLDTGLAGNTCYRYNVQAINAIGIGSTAENNVTATTNPSPIQTHIPNSPILGVTTASNTSLKLTWTIPSDNGGSPITGYLIQRNGTTIVSNTSSNQTIFTDTNLLPLHQQTYQVAAWNSVGLGSFSNSISGITNPTIPPFGNGTNQTSNLGQLISNLEHQRNQLLKQQRQETLAIIHDCRTQIKNASAENKTQIIQDCKTTIKNSQQKYKNLTSQLKTQLAQLKAELKSQISVNKKEKHSEKESSDLVNMTRNFKNNSENKNNHLGNMTKHSENKLPNFQNIINHFEKKSGKQNNQGKHNQGNGQQSNHQNED
jgi:titin